MKKLLSQNLILWITLILSPVAVSPLEAQNPLLVPPALTGPTFNLTMERGTMDFGFGGLTPTAGYNGSFLGPTLIMERDEDVVLNVTNELGEITTTHWHGMHVSSENDGGPHTKINPGETWSPSFTVMDGGATMWYHPHLHMLTNRHITLGLAGMILVRDEIETSANLPRTYGVDEFPLFLMDRLVGIENQFIVAGLGETLLVNGTPDAYLEVPAQMVRFRVVNASAERGYYFGLADGKSFQLIGTDGGLQEAPLSMGRMLVTPGERLDVVVDLGGMEGMTLDVMAFNSELTGIDIPGSPNGPGGGNVLDGLDLRLVQLRVGAPTAEPVMELANTLQAVARLTEAQATRTRRIVMTGSPPAPFFLDDQPFDHEVINQRVDLNAVEIWEIENDTSYAHPFHIHDVQFFILDIDGEPPPPEFSGRKDTILVRRRSTVRFIAIFDDHSSSAVPYMYHCHVLTHEDEGMMAQFIVQGNQRAPVIFEGPARVVNLSTRAQVGGSAGSPIAGFVIEGAGAKKMVVRAVGPTLRSYGVTTGLSDPDLFLSHSNQRIAANDRWGQDHDDLFAALGAFALDTQSEDAALVGSLGPGIYTMPVGDGGESGVVLLEIYDAVGGAEGPELTNASTLAEAGSGDATLILGVVVGGEGTVKLLIRAIGPTLASDYNVPGALADVSIKIIRENTQIAANDNWGTSSNVAEIEQAAATVGAFAISRTSLDAAVLIELAPGPYSIVSEAIGGTPGKVLMEIYRVP